ncbi:MAG: nucleotidyltransferase [Nanoarchaeota archaeon]|nr:nucleotidyltransferase [Nanoarchaeota archaeon]
MKRCIKMYENNYKNIKTANLTDLEIFLQLIADLDQELELFAIGGTAMVLKNIKESTKDIDFLTNANYETISRLFLAAGLIEKSKSKLVNIWFMKEIRVDIFYEEYILGISLPDDWKQLSEQIKTIGKIKLYILNWYDLIITKIARAEKRDYEDIMAIIKTQKVDFKKLKKRYYDISEEAIISDPDEKFKHLERMLK